MDMARFGRTMCGVVFLWRYFNNRTNWHELIDFLHFLVGNGDTPFRPINPGMRGTDRRETIFDAVDHDIAARRDTKFLGAFFVLRVWIGNMKREVKTAVAVS